VSHQRQTDRRRAWRTIAQAALLAAPFARRPGQVTNGGLRGAPWSLCWNVPTYVSTKRGDSMARQIPDAVLTTREAREHLSDFLAEARRHGAGAPVRFYGARRRPEAAVMSAELAKSLLDLMDEVVIAEAVRERLGQPTTSGTVDDFLGGAGLDVARLRRLRAARRGA
jgi:hypothetical protein